MFHRLKQVLFNKYFWFLFIPLLIGWALLGLRLESRTQFAQYRQMDSVKRIWGGNLTQPVPSIRYKSIGSEVADLSKGAIDASEVTVNLLVNYRKKGLVYYTGYEADFEGKYTIRNNKGVDVYLSFIFPYPMKQGEGMLRDVRLLVDGLESPLDTEYQEDLILWTGLLKAGQPLEVSVRYKGRGLNNFIYGFEPGRQINGFKMTVRIAGSGEVDYPESTMTPTKVTSTDEGSTLVWELDRVLTQSNIGVTLPDKINVARQITIMSKRAPVFFLMFLGSFFAILSLNRRRLNYLQALIVGAAYFLFYPLFAYLSAYMDVSLSYLISLAVIGLLIFNYARAVYGWKISLTLSASYLLFLGVTSLAALLPNYTGLILTIEGVVVMAAAMHVLSRRENLKFGDLFQGIGSGQTGKKSAPNETAVEAEDFEIEVPAENTDAPPKDHTPDGGPGTK